MLRRTTISALAIVLVTTSCIFDTDESTPIEHENVENRGKPGGTSQVGNPLPDGGGWTGERRKGEGVLTVTPNGPSGAAGVVKVKSSPPGRGAPDMDSVEFRVHDLESRTTYQVCVDCTGLNIGGPSSAQGGAAGRSIETTLTSSSDFVGEMRVEFDFRSVGTNFAQDDIVTIGTPVLVSSVDVHVPILLATNDKLIGAKFTVEYHSSCLSFVGARKGSELASLSSALDPSSATASGATAPNDMRVSVLQLVIDPTESFGPGQDLEVVVLEFARNTSPSAPCQLVWDPSRTTLTTSAGIEHPPTAFIPLPPAGVPLPSQLACVGLLTTDRKGDGRLRIRQLKGDVLPCGVQHVWELQGRAVEVREEGTGIAVLEGTIPAPRP